MVDDLSLKPFPDVTSSNVTSSIPDVYIDSLASDLGHATGSQKSNGPMASLRVVILFERAKAHLHERHSRISTIRSFLLASEMAINPVRTQSTIPSCSYMAAWLGG